MELSVEDQIVNQFLKSERILLLPSAPADGDTLGSSFALYKVLQKLGKEVTVLCPESPPKDLQFLPLIDRVNQEDSGGEVFTITIDADAKNVRHEMVDGKVKIIVTPGETPISKDKVSFNEGLKQYDILVTVDTGDLQQLGKFYEDNTELFHSVPLINIDHHASNSEFGTINHVNITASATTEMLLPIIEKMEEQTGKDLMDEDIATLLLAGIVTDTGSFQHSNTTPKSFVVSAQLLELGARQQEIIKHVFKTKSLSTLRLWGEVLSKVRFEKELRLVWSTITQQDLHDTGATVDESGGIIDELLNNAPGSEVIALFKEKQPGLFSGSLRTTTPDVDASEIAGLFGGGGHKRAAGFRIKGTSFDDALKKVVKTIREYQAKRLGLKVPFNEPPREADSEDYIHLHPQTAEDPDGIGYYKFEE